MITQVPWTDESRFASWYPRIVILVDLIGKAIGEPMAPRSSAALLCIKRGVDAANFELLCARERGPVYWSRLGPVARDRIALNGAAEAIARHLLVQAPPQNIAGLRMKLSAFLAWSVSALEPSAARSALNRHPPVAPQPRDDDPSLDPRGAA